MELTEEKKAKELDVDFNNTPIYRMTHIGNLASAMQDGAIYCSSHYPPDAPFVSIHNTDVQAKRACVFIPFQFGLTLCDCVPFYFGVLTPMLLVNKAHQDEIIYFITTVQAVAAAGCRFAFTDGHALMRISEWYNTLEDLKRLDWESIHRQYWGRNVDPTGEYMRKKQAEFLVYNSLDWSLIEKIAVRTQDAAKEVVMIQAKFPAEKRKPVFIAPKLYFR